METWATVLVIVLTGCGATTAATNPKFYGTWLWNGSTWNELAASGEQPKPIGGLPGGETLWYLKGSGGLTDADGTNWNGTAWAAVNSPLPIPPGQSEFPNDLAGSVNDALIVDEARNQLLFADSQRQTLWALSNGVWRQAVTVERWPSARFVYGAAYDPVRANVVLLFCCQVGETDIETWVWNGHTLAQGAPLPFPHTTLAVKLPSGQLTLVPDDSGDLVVFGHQPSLEFSQQPGYIWDGREWRAAATSVVWPPESCNSVGYDTASEQTICVSAGATGDVHTWIWQRGSWTRSAAGTQPPPGCGISNLVYDPELHGLVMTDLNVECAGFLP